MKRVVLNDRVYYDHEKDVFWVDGIMNDPSLFFDEPKNVGGYNPISDAFPPELLLKGAERKIKTEIIDYIIARDGLYAETIEGDVLFFPFIKRA